MQNNVSIEQIPDYATDIKLNLSSLFRSGGTPGLTETQRNGVALAAAHAARNPTFARYVEHYFAEGTEVNHLRAAKSAAAIMAMTNIYYRFTHLVGDAEYGKMPARLRMNGLASHDIDPLDFELYALAASIVGGCGQCIKAHEHEVRQKGISREGVQSVARIASVIHAAAAILGNTPPMPS
jgi:lipoyl-dependent peroxiredoxin subunit D